MASPPSRVCPLCASQDSFDPPVRLADGIWQFVCRGPHALYVFDVQPSNDLAAYPEGLAADLGLYDDLPKCITDETTYVEYGIVEYRYGLAHPKEYGQLVATYGRRSQGKGKTYTASAFIASTLGRIARDGVLRFEFGKGTGYWSYDDPISYWAPPGVNEPPNRLTWFEFATENGWKPRDWPL